jgi:site-specific DNA-methyltransferase (adenine-specific)
MAAEAAKAEELPFQEVQAASEGDLTDTEPDNGGTRNTRGRFARYKCTRTGGTWASKYSFREPAQEPDGGMGGEIQNYPPPQGLTHKPPQNIEFWDFAPPQEYFDELFRVSRNQIIWGGNYFSLPPTRCFLVWRKLTISETFTMAMCEYAWTSFNGNAKFVEIAPQGNAKHQRFHPTEKPVKLYTWCLGLFAKPGMRLLDTHGGSMSSGVAAWQLGIDMDICEINEFYYNEGRARVEREMRQPNLF